MIEIKSAIEIKQAYEIVLRRLAVSNKNSFDNEQEHIMADEALCDFLKEIGFSDVAEAFENLSSEIGFWYV